MTWAVQYSERELEVYERLTGGVVGETWVGNKIQSAVMGWRVASKPNTTHKKMSRHLPISEW